MDAVKLISPIAAVVDTIRPAGGAAPAGGAEFGQFFSQALSQVNGLQKSAQASVERFLEGGNEELHQVALATQKAELSFELMLQMRNKAVQAYQEIMRMQM